MQEFLLEMKNMFYPIKKTNKQTGFLLSAIVDHFKQTLEKTLKNQG